MVDSMVMAICGRSRVAPVLAFPLGEGVLCACCEMMCEGVKAHVVYYYTDRTGVSRGKLGNFVGILGEKGVFDGDFNARVWGRKDKRLIFLG